MHVSPSRRYRTFEVVSHHDAIPFARSTIDHSKREAHCGNKHPNDPSVRMTSIPGRMGGVKICAATVNVAS